MTPQFATDKSAAKLLDMKPKQFRELVKSRCLPPPISIGDLERWNMEEVYKAIRGEPWGFDGKDWS